MSGPPAPAGPVASLSQPTLAARQELVTLGSRYHRAGWLLGTSGNLSARVTTPAGERLVVTASGCDKGHLSPADFVELDLGGSVRAAGPGRRPSAEAAIHLALYRTRPGTRVVLHVHTVASTLAAPDGAFDAVAGDDPVSRLTFTGLEMIKGWGLWDDDDAAHLPIFRNWSEVSRIAAEVERFYRARPAERVPALLIASHGITAWGDGGFSANRHLEVTEFLCRVSSQR